MWYFFIVQSLNIWPFFSVCRQIETMRNKVDAIRLIINDIPFVLFKKVFCLPSSVRARIVREEYITRYQWMYVQCLIAIFVQRNFITLRVLHLTWFLITKYNYWSCNVQIPDRIIKSSLLKFDPKTILSLLIDKRN